MDDEGNTLRQPRCFQVSRFLQTAPNRRICGINRRSRALVPKAAEKAKRAAIWDYSQNHRPHLVNIRITPTQTLITPGRRFYTNDVLSASSHGPLYANSTPCPLPELLWSALDRSRQTPRGTVPAREHSWFLLQTCQERFKYVPWQSQLPLLSVMRLRSRVDGGLTDVKLVLVRFHPSKPRVRHMTTRNNIRSLPFPTSIASPFLSPLIQSLSSE